MDFRTSILAHFPQEEAERLLDAIENGKQTHALLVNPKKLNEEEFVRRYPNVRKVPFVEHAFYYDKDEYDFGKNIFYDNGVFSIQDASAMMVNYFLKPEPGDTILDMCAAPGGKTIGASFMMEDTGVIIANDISYPRAKAMSQNIERMGRGNIIVASTDFVFSRSHFADSFDKIIVDAPCSGSAMFRKNELSRHDWRIEKVKSNARKQLELLEYAYEMLKPGGLISYSTCSFSYEENEGTLDHFFLNHAEASLVKLPADERFYRPIAYPEAVYLLPSRFEGEGQFIAIIKKPGEIRKDERKLAKAPSQYAPFLKEFGLDGRSNEVMRSKFYSIYQSFDVSHLNILRYGVKLFEMRKIYIPDHHLAHFLTPDYSIPISLEDAKKYIKGETFELNRPDDFYIVSYDSQNLGFVKTVNGVAKNHYPKGLRRDWDPEK